MSRTPHHFGDKTGLLTALATEGFEILADALLTAQQRTGDFLEVGVAYVRFAVQHRAHFEVMYRPDLYHSEDPALRAARDRAGQVLYAGAAAVVQLPADTDVRVAGLAAWSLVHGFASLWMQGSLPVDLRDDPEGSARLVAGMLFRT